MLYEHHLVARGLARWYRGRLIPVMRGGVEQDEPLFALPPSKTEGVYDFGSFEDDELASLAASLRERVKEVFTGKRDPEVVGERTQSQVAEEMQAAVLAIEKIDAELDSRAKDESEYDAELEGLAAKAGVKAETAEGDTPEGDPPPDDDDDKDKDVAAVEGDTPEDKPETPAPTLAVRSRPLPAARRNRPTPSEDFNGSGLRVTSHAAGLGSPYGAQEVLDRDAIGLFLTDVVRRNRVQPGQKAVLAHASYSFPDTHQLVDGPDGHLTNSKRVREVLADPEFTKSSAGRLNALLASGALCAPFPAIYDLPGVETPVRPVRGAIPTFEAARGGVQVGATPTMGDYATAVDVVTQAENAAGGTSAVKNCLRISCPAFSTVTVDAIYQCIEADNLAARAYPELLSRINDLVMAEQARLADSKLLSALKTGSTNVSGGEITLGAVAALMYDVFRAAAAYRSRNRMAEGATLQALFPAWVIDLLSADFVRGQNDREKTRAQITALLEGAGIAVTYYLDGPATGTGQVFGTQSGSDAALADFPDYVQWGLWAPGTWIHLDAGELQLGVVRDSTLNSTNDFQIFSETWENIAFVGVESLWVSSRVCPTGEVAAPSAESNICGT